MSFYSDSQAFFEANEGRLFHFWVYRKMFTPYESQNAFSDESVFEDTHATSGYLVDCVMLGFGDCLFGFVEGDDSDDVPLWNKDSVGKWISYYRLSEIRLQKPDGQEVSL